MSTVVEPVKSFEQIAGRGLPSGHGLPGTEFYREQRPASALQSRTMLVLDCSGSMGNIDWAPTRLDGAKKASAQLVHNRRSYHPGACIGIVGFSDLGMLSSPLVPVEPPDVCLKAVAQLKPVAGTNLGAGLETALQELKRVAGASLMACEIVALTDGDTAKPDRALAVADEAKQLGCVVHVVGIGGNPAAVNETLLRAIASNDGDGRSLYQFIGDEGRLVRHFGIIGRGITR